MPCGATQHGRVMVVSFIKESHYGETVQFIIDDSDPMDSRLSVTHDGADLVRARFHWHERATDS